MIYGTTSRSNNLLETFFKKFKLTKITTAEISLNFKHIGIQSRLSQLDSAPELTESIERSVGVR